MMSSHYRKDRRYRDHIIDEIGHGVEVYSFPFCYKGIEQVHNITNTGIINVYDKYTHKLVTRLVARPAQIDRYFETVGEIPPKWLIDQAQRNKERRFNV